MNKIWLLLTLCITFTKLAISQNVALYKITAGEVSFVSEAPLEIISAKSEKLKGVINTGSNTFAFTIPVNSFDGFNSQLQKEHFNENYVESERFPNAIFKGKIIEFVDFFKDGVYDVRAKGFLELHGVRNEMIIPCRLEVKAEKISAECSFEIELEDFDIKVPKIVNQKIANTIAISVTSQLKLN